MEKMKVKDHLASYIYYKIILFNCCYTIENQLKKNNTE